MSSITYTVGQLKKLFSNKYQIGNSVWNKLQDLKIIRPFRGSRGGVLVKARSRENEETKRRQRQISKNQPTTNNLSTMSVNCNKHVWRTMIVNCRSIKANNSDFLSTVDDFQPDCILGSESWLDHSIYNAEVFPINYNIYRRDRNIHGGGVFIAVSNDYISSNVTIQENNSEIVWAKVDLNSTKSLLLGNFYRPPDAEIETFEGLQKSVQQLTKSINNKHVILGGDFNLPDIDWNTKTVNPGGKNKQFSESVLDLMDDYSLEQVVQEPTIGKNILDLCFTNQPSLVNKVNIVSGISDHDIVIMDSSIKPKFNKKKSRKVYRFTDENIASVRRGLELLNTKFLKSNPHFNSVDKNWSFFKTSIQQVVEKYVPSKMTSTRYHLPWMDKNLKKLSSNKHKLYNRAKSTGKSEDWDKFKLVKHQCQKERRASHNQYVADLLKTSYEEKTSKKFWKYIKSRKTDNVEVQPLRSEGKLHSDDKDKAEILNKQFKSVFTKDSESFKEQSLHKPQFPKIKEIHICEKGVTKLLKELKVNSASGPDDISNRILKHSAEELSPVLTFIFRQSLTNGILPSDWLKANVVPMYKKSDKQQAENYRPVSLTSVCCKIMEHVLCKHLRNHLDRCNILTKFQHGFRRHHSCETQLLITLDDILKNYDQKHQLDIIILDFSKAFDKVSHNLLLTKLYSMGVSGAVHKWISAFLHNRTQRVVVNGVFSDDAPVSSGVPQGSVLGPLLFLCYINDLPNCVKSQVRLFADDSLLYRTINSVHDAVQLQEDLTALEVWANTWKMHFNPTKCYLMRYCRSRTPIITPYILRNHKLAEHVTNPYLGVLLSNDAKWSKHISAICNQANATLGFLRRNLYNCPKDLKKLAYIALVRSKLEYASCVWNPYLVKDITLLEKIQRRSVRFICHNYDWSTSVTDMLRDLELETLEERRSTTSICMFFKIINNEVAISQNEHLERSSSSTRRSHKLQYKHFATSTEAYKNSFFPRSVPIWNKLNSNLISCDKSENFKQALSKYQS